jgi:pilus assembly protein CpaE
VTLDDPPETIAGRGVEATFEAEGEALLPRQTRGRGRLLAVIAGKAGTGKSVLAANLAAAAARHLGLTTAIVDLALQFGDQALMFDAPSAPSLVDVLANVDALTPDFLLECMYTSRGVHVLAAPPSPELADLVQLEHLDRILEQLAVLFDLVVVDTSSHLGDVTLETIDRADALLLVVTPYLASVKDTKLLLKLLSDLSVPPRKLTTVLNRLEPGLKMSTEALEANIRFPISFELPHTPVALLEAATDGVPVVISRPSLEFSQRLVGIAAALAQPEEGEGRHGSRRGFLRLGR